MPHRDLSATELVEVVEDLAARTSLWRPRVRMAGDRRFFERLTASAHVEVWLNSWLHDQDTGFHDHDVSAGAVAVLAGQVREDRLRLEGGIASRTVAAGSSFSFDSAAIHRVVHAGDEPAVTMHAYSPPLRRMGSYEIAEDGMLRRHSVASDAELRPLAVAPATAVAG